MARAAWLRPTDTCGHPALPLRQPRQEQMDFPYARFLISHECCSLAESKWKPAGRGFWEVWFPGFGPLQHRGVESQRWSVLWRRMWTVSNRQTSAATSAGAADSIALDRPHRLISSGREGPRSQPWDHIWRLYRNKEHACGKERKQSLPQLGFERAQPAWPSSPATVKPSSVRASGVRSLSRRSCQVAANSPRDL